MYSLFSMSMYIPSILSVPILTHRHPYFFCIHFYTSCIYTIFSQARHTVILTHLLQISGCCRTSFIISFFVLYGTFSCVHLEHSVYSIHVSNLDTLLIPVFLHLGRTALLHHVFDPIYIIYPYFVFT